MRVGPGDIVRYKSRRTRGTGTYLFTVTGIRSATDPQDLRVMTQTWVREGGECPTRSGDIEVLHRRLRPLTAVGSWLLFCTELLALVAGAMNAASLKIPWMDRFLVAVCPMLVIYLGIVAFRLVTSGTRV